MLKYGLSRDLAHRIFNQFKEEGLICEVKGDTSGYLPARALSDITLEQAIEAFEGDMEFQEGDEFPQSTEQLLEQLRAVPHEIARNQSVEQLLVPLELTEVYLNVG